MNGRRWIVFVVVLLLANVGAVSALIAASGGEGQRQVLPDYYRRAAAWDQHMSAEQSSLDLGWKATAVLRAGGITVALRDRDGLPVSGAWLSVTGHHRAHADHPIEQRLLEAEPGQYRSAVTLLFPGLWDLDVRAHRGEVAWVNRVVADSGAP